MFQTTDCLRMTFTDTVGTVVGLPLLEQQLLGLESLDTHLPPRHILPTHSQCPGRQGILIHHLYQEPLQVIIMIKKLPSDQIMIKKHLSDQIMMTRNRSKSPGGRGLCSSPSIKRPNSLMPGTIKFKFEYSLTQIEFLDLSLRIESGGIVTNM